jgi:hypothetical protein
MTRPGITVFSSYSFNKYVTIRIGIAHGWIQGSDSLSLAPTRYTRNLSFRNQLIEAYARGEITVINWQMTKRGGKFRLGIQSFLYAGAAMFQHNPKTYYNGSWVALQPLNTENLDYKLFQPSFPVGGGLRVNIGRHHEFGWDLGWRITTTDFLDHLSSVYYDHSSNPNPVVADIADRCDEVNVNDERFIGTDMFAPSSPRGNPETKDSYIFSYFTYAYVLGNGPKKLSKSRYSFSKPATHHMKSSFKKKKHHNRPRKKTLHRKKHLKIKL